MILIFYFSKLLSSQPACAALKPTEKLLAKVKHSIITIESRFTTTHILVNTAAFVLHSILCLQFVWKPTVIVEKLCVLH